MSFVNTQVESIAIMIFPDADWMLKMLRFI